MLHSALSVVTTHTRTHTNTRTDLVDSAGLTLNAVVLGPGATRPPAPRQVQTHHMLVSGEMLVKKTNTPN